ncbi:hypothetical protein [Dactylosporangium sp. NPDC049140]|uniref:hypothetical protein n=1 Tax=Dactylosporangium sp. NPDC049140 TaxID=3155647 RepID=UPI003410AA0F
MEPQVSASFAQRARTTVLVATPLAILLTCAAMYAAHAGLLWRFLCVPIGVVVGFAAGALVLVWPVLRALWWWTPEVLGLSAVVAAWLWLSQWLAWWGGLAVLAFGVGGLGLVGPVRRRAAAVFWCLSDRHRLRLSFTRIVRATGRGGVPMYPLMLWARPTLAGERVWVLLRPGLDLADLEGKTGKLAVACWASEVRVARASKRSAALLQIDVNRRDPLTEKVPSPLAEVFGRLRKPKAAPDGDLDLALDFEQVAAPAPAAPGRTRR